MSALASAVDRSGARGLQAPVATRAIVDEASTSIRLGPHLRILVDDSARLTHAGAREADSAGRFLASKTPRGSRATASPRRPCGCAWSSTTCAPCRTTARARVGLRAARSPRALARGPCHTAACRRGDALPFEERAYEYRHPTFELHGQSGQRVYYLRASGYSSLQLPLSCTRRTLSPIGPSAIRRHRRSTSGLMLALIVYNYVPVSRRPRAGANCSTPSFMALYLTYQGVDRRGDVPVHLAWLPLAGRALHAGERGDGGHLRAAGSR